MQKVKYTKFLVLNFIALQRKNKATWPFLFSNCSNNKNLTFGFQSLANAMKHTKLLQISAVHLFLPLTYMVHQYSIFFDTLQENVALSCQFLLWYVIFEIFNASMISQEAFNNYVDRILPFFDPPPFAWTVFKP